MDLAQLLELLARMVRLIEEMQNSADYIGKQDVVSHLRWSSEHLSRDIWARTVHKDYSTNGNA